MRKYFSSYWIRSAFYTFLHRFSLTLFGLVNFMLLIRSLSPSQMGIWALFLLVTSIFEATKTNLLKNAHIRYASSNTNQQEKTAIASSSLFINLSLTVIFIVLLFLAGNKIGTWLNTGRELTEMLQWFIPGLLGMVAFSHLEAIQQSHLDFKGVFIGYFARQSLFFVFILSHLVLKLPFNLIYLAIYQSISILVGTCFLFFATRKYLLFQFRLCPIWIRRLLGYGGYIFGSGMLANIFANLDQVMTASFMSSTSVAYYNTASRINGLVDIPSYAAADILFPKVSQASAAESSQKVKYLYERMVAILLSFTTPAALFIILFPNLVITIIAGQAYIAAAPILQLYMLSGLLRPMQNQAANILNSIGKPALCFTINAISLAANLLINYLCLLEFGFYGAAIGTLVTCLLGTIAWYFIMRKQIQLQLLNVFMYAATFYRDMYRQANGYLTKTVKHVHS